MRTLTAFLALFVFTVSHAQVDINKMIRERMEQQGSTGKPAGPTGGVTMEDDTDPFVPNEFSGSFVMVMRFYKGDAEEKHSPSNMHYWSKEDMTLQRVEGAEQPGRELKILTDLKGKWTYTLMTDKNGKKTAMKSRKQKFVGTDADQGKKQAEVNVTNETKVINGHTCTKVIATAEDGTWTGWVAMDVKGPFNDMARNATKQSSPSRLRNAEGISGMTMEFEWVSADGTERMTAQFQDLVIGSVDGSVFSLDGYDVMEIPSFAMPKR